MNEMGKIITDTFEEMQQLHEDLIPWYKDALQEPFVKINKGYRGVVLKNKIDGTIMCNDCGMQYKALSQHVMLTHDYESLAQYKERNGIAQNIALVTEELSANSRKNAIKGRLKHIGKKYIKSLTKEQRLKIIKNRRSHNPTSRQNKYGTCSDAQLKHRLDVLAKMVGRNPSSVDARKNGEQSLVRIFEYTYGSWNKGKKVLGYTTYKRGTQGYKYSDEAIISTIRKWVIKHKKIPIASDFSNKSIFLRRFGSWNKAKMMAGVSQLLLEIR